MKLTVFLALVAGAAVAILFTVFPEWDLAITGWFWDKAAGHFYLAATPWGQWLRKAGNIIPWLFAGPAFAAILLKLIFPGGRMFMPARAAVFLALTMALAPGLLVNGILKENWGRPRPVHVETFGGKDVFNPWYAAGGACPTNCSFVSGEGALGFWMIAPATLVPAPYRGPALLAAAAFGTAAGGLRITFGGHFFTDVAFSAVLTILVIALARWLIFTRSGAPTDAWMEAFLGSCGRVLQMLALRLFRLARWSLRHLWRGLRGLIARIPLPRRGSGL